MLFLLSDVFHTVEVAVTRRNMSFISENRITNFLYYLKPLDFNAVIAVLASSFLNL